MLRKDNLFMPPPEAPIFRPTEAEFANPLTYIEKIRPSAEKHGICKIIPPPNWQPPFAADVDKLRFTPRVQKLNELEARTRVKLNFLDKIAKFWELEGFLLKIPLVDKHALDLYTLYRLVEKEGGYDAVKEGRRWGAIAMCMGFPMWRGFDLILRSSYEKLLYPFEIFIKGNKNRNEDTNDGIYRKFPKLTDIRPLPANNSRTNASILSESKQNNNKNMRNYKTNPTRLPTCHNCNSGHNTRKFLSCHGCKEKYHTYCLNPVLLEIPEGNWFCPQCVIAEIVQTEETFGFEQAQKTYDLHQFGEMADRFKSEYFRKPGHVIPTRVVEAEFWRIVSLIEEDVTVEYGADLHTVDHGSGFPTSGMEYGKEYAGSAWNLNNTPLLEGSALRFVQKGISGMTIPWMYIGMCFSTFCWHNEDHWTYSINYLHWGEPKTWYGVSGAQADLFEDVMKSSAPELFQNQPDLLHQLVTMMNPNTLMHSGVKVYRTDQNAGEFIVTFPRAYHAGFNQGYNFAEAVNFAPADWIKMGRSCVLHYSQLHRFCVFSHDELVCKMAERCAELSISEAAAAYADMLKLVEIEIEFRKKLLKIGVRKAKKFYFDSEDDDQRQCEACKTTCFTSAVVCDCNRDVLLCLKHCGSFCECPRTKLTLLYRYTLDEFIPLLKSLNSKAGAYDDWLRRVKSFLSLRDVDLQEEWGIFDQGTYEHLDQNPVAIPTLQDLKTLLSEGEGWAKKGLANNIIIKQFSHAILGVEFYVNIIKRVRLDEEEIKMLQLFEDKDNIHGKDNNKHKNHNHAKDNHVKYNTLDEGNSDCKDNHSKNNTNDKNNNDGKDNHAKSNIYDTDNHAKSNTYDKDDIDSKSNTYDNVKNDHNYNKPYSVLLDKNNKDYQNASLPKTTVLSLHELKVLNEAIKKIPYIIKERIYLMAILRQAEMLENLLLESGDYTQKDVLDFLQECRLELKNLPGLKTLRKRCEQLKWIQDVAACIREKDSVDVNDTKELCLKGAILPNISFEELERVLGWEKRAKALMEGNNFQGVAEAVDLLKEADDLRLCSHTQDSLIDQVNKSRELLLRLNEINSWDYYPFLQTIEGCLRQSEEIVFHFEEVDCLKRGVLKADLWLKHAAEVFAKSGDCDLLEILSPRNFKLREVLENIYENRSCTDVDLSEITLFSRNTNFNQMESSNCCENTLEVCSARSADLSEKISSSRFADSSEKTYKIGSPRFSELNENAYKIGSCRFSGFSEKTPKSCSDLSGNSFRVTSLTNLDGGFIKICPPENTDFEIHSANLSENIFENTPSKGDNFSRNAFGIQSSTRANVGETNFGLISSPNASLSNNTSPRNTKTSGTTCEIPSYTVDRRIGSKSNVDKLMFDREANLSETAFDYSKIDLNLEKAASARNSSSSITFGDPQQMDVDLEKDTSSSRNSNVSLIIVDDSEIDRNFEKSASTKSAKSCYTSFSRNSDFSQITVDDPQMDLDYEKLGPPSFYEITDSASSRSADSMGDANFADPDVVISLFEKAAAEELAQLKRIRAENIRIDTPSCKCGENTICVLMRCELCKNFIHDTCAELTELSKQAYSKKADLYSPYAKFLCPRCLRSKRPSLDVISNLLKSLTKINLRLYEGEALQFLARRALNWLERAERLLRTQEVAGILNVIEEVTKISDEELKREKYNLSLSDSTLCAIEDMLVEGDLLEVSLEENQTLWLISYVCRDFKHEEHQKRGKNKQGRKKKHWKTVAKKTELDENENSCRLNSGMQTEFQSVSKEKTDSDDAHQFDAYVKNGENKHGNVIEEKNCQDGDGNVMKGNTNRDKNVMKYRNHPYDLYKSVKKQKKNHDGENKRNKNSRNPEDVRVLKNLIPLEETTSSGSSSSTSMDSLQNINPLRIDEEFHLSEESDNENKCAASADCLLPHGEELDWVQCDGTCEGWFHVVCVGLSIRDIKEEEDFICKTCSPNDRHECVD